MDKELIILEQIQNNPHVNQRDLATITKASLGMTNAILKRFVEKGLITIMKVNNRNIRYALTAEGMEELNRRSWNYFKRTIKNVVVYRDAISEVIRQAMSDGYKGIALVGESDFAFIVEHECYKQNAPYRAVKKDYRETEADWFLMLAEIQQHEQAEQLKAPTEEEKNSFSLNRLVIQQ